MTQGTPKLAGILSALVTPFTPDGALNEAVVPALVEFQLAQGIHGFYVGGSTGEAFLQSPEERVRFLRAAAKANAGRGALIAHVGAIATREVVAMGRVAADAGYDAVSAVPPFYYDFSATELTVHYKELADAVPLPVVVYNFGGKVPKLTTEVILRLLDDRRFAGVKHTSTDLYQLERFKAHRPDAAVFNGYDEMCLGGLAMGADGAIGTTYNVMGSLFVAIRTAFQAGRMAEALAMQRRANRVIDLLVEVGVFPGTKAMLRLLGQDVGACRPPFGPMPEGAEARLRACLDGLQDHAAAA